jgi:hypothetical protein
MKLMVELPRTLGFPIHRVYRCEVCQMVLNVTTE